MTQCDAWIEQVREIWYYTIKLSAFVENTDIAARICLCVCKASL